ncbi:MAG: DUF7305 domain-containing protein [Planctomycetota bacterium]|jgi:hypothetical protein
MLLQSVRKGSALPLVMAAVLLLFVMGMGLMSLGMHSRILAIRSGSELVARCAADAGLTQAVYEMNEKLKIQPWDDSSLPLATGQGLPGCSATFTYAVKGDLGSGYYLESIGNYILADRKVRCILPLQGPFEKAIFVQGTLTLKAGTLVTGYNSGDPSVTDVELTIGTNSTLSDSIVLNSGVTVDGDVVIGPLGVLEDVIRDLGASTDDQYALTEEVEFPPVTAPGLPNKGILSIHGSTVVIGPADSGHYNKIVLKRADQPGILQISGGEVVLEVSGNIDLGQDCEIVVLPDASLTSYLGGDLNTDNNAGINNQNVPGSFKLYGTGTNQTFTIRAKSDVLGAVYAPNADITIMAFGDIYGAFVGNSFQMMSGGNFYYDEALKNVNVYDEAVQFVVRGWSEE